MTKVYCGYCGDGPYKEDYIGLGDGNIGGIINGYWFCGWCIELGYNESKEGDRWQKLTEEAKRNDATKIVKNN